MPSQVNILGLRMPTCGMRNVSSLGYHHLANAGVRQWARVTQWL